MNDDTNQRAQDCGRFADYSDADLLGQLRMEARGQLDPEYCQFLWAVHARFKALTSTREEALREAAEMIEKISATKDRPAVLWALDEARNAILQLIGKGG